MEVRFFKTFIFGIIGTLMFGCATGVSINCFFLIGNQIGIGSFLVVFCFVVFFVGSVFMVLFSKKASFTETAVIVETFFGRYKIDVEKIEYIEECAGNLTIGNATQCLSLPAFEHWNRKALSEFFPKYAMFLKAKGIEIRTTVRALWPRFTNTCIGKNYSIPEA